MRNQHQLTKEECERILDCVFTPLDGSSENQKSEIPNPKYLVRWTGNYAVQFHSRGFSLVADDEATLFSTEAEAHAKALATATLYSYRGGKFTVEQLIPKKS